MQELTAEQLREKMESGERFIIDYFATWCGPCKMLSRILETSGDKLGVPIYKFDVDSDLKFTMEQNVRSVPTLKLYEGSLVVKSHTGILQESEFDGFLN
jgi:thiol-disulfide isomerase/thioredoxin